MDVSLRGSLLLHQIYLFYNSFFWITRTRAGSLLQINWHQYMSSIDIFIFYLKFYAVLLTLDLTKNISVEAGRKLLNKSTRGAYQEYGRYSRYTKHIFEFNCLSLGLVAASLRKTNFGYLSQRKLTTICSLEQGLYFDTKNIPLRLI